MTTHSLFGAIRGFAFLAMCGFAFLSCASSAPRAAQPSNERRLADALHANGRDEQSFHYSYSCHYIERRSGGDAGYVSYFFTSSYIPPIATWKRFPTADALAEDLRDRCNKNTLVVTLQPGNVHNVLETRLDPNDPEWAIRALDASEMARVERVLSGTGCLVISDVLR